MIASVLTVADPGVAGLWYVLLSPQVYPRAALVTAVYFLSVVFSCHNLSPFFSFMALQSLTSWHTNKIFLAFAVTTRQLISNIY